ncbi:unnamed protein product [Darwinula stevensoni]|uniref:Uncharacterized protein n=1 Tax=Darwinula stevensoni TaxID=69355 RepID=A0A7R9ABH2_9CRUS|nr:unnamed protein product [Darwinula stevensoni]CAG0898961.1 unnamed protein product [Darwinula stevensoni]
MRRTNTGAAPFGSDQHVADDKGRVLHAASVDRRLPIPGYNRGRLADAGIHVEDLTWDNSWKLLETWNLSLLDLHDKASLDMLSLLREFSVRTVGTGGETINCRPMRMAFREPTGSVGFGGVVVAYLTGNQKVRVQLQAIPGAWRTASWDGSSPVQKLACLNPILITKEVNLTKPVCLDPDSSKVMLEELEKTRKYFIDPESEIGKNCSSPKRCHRSIYYIFPDPNSNGEQTSSNRFLCILIGVYLRGTGKDDHPRAPLRHLRVVGICLGVSIVNIFDLVDGACSRIRCKLLSCRKKIIQGSNH